MSRKLTNKPLSRDDAKMAALARALQRDEAKVLDAMGIASDVAKAALNSWYDTGYSRARKLILKEQIESNLKVVASIYQDGRNRKASEMATL